MPNSTFPAAPTDTGSMLFYIRERLDEITVKLIDDKLRHIPGVIAPWFNPERAHLLFIYFNREKIELPGLVFKVRKFGLDAKVIC